ncbi:MAG: hypothetical protein KIG86_07410 [Eubacteriales bacterium]|nr:hypothetical protein [Eubacteriales bacterium]MCI6943371.1 hypothetical protein [Christensenellaceae bacterium]
MLIDRLRKLKKYDPKKAETLFDEIHKEGGLEKGDLKALILSAFAVFLPIALGILLLFVLVAWAFTGFAT